MICCYSTQVYEFGSGGRGPSIISLDSGMHAICGITNLSSSWPSSIIFSLTYLNQTVHIVQYQGIIHNAISECITRTP